MPVYWKLHGSILEFTLSELLMYCAVKVLVSKLKVTTPLAILITIAGVMMFWVFRLGHLVGWKFKYWNETRIVKVRSLHNKRVVAIWNRNHTLQDRQHSRWRRRRRKLKHRRIFKRRVLDREELSKELYKKRKLLHQRKLLLQQRKFKTIHQRKQDSSLQRKFLQSSQQWPTA